MLLHASKWSCLSLDHDISFLPECSIDVGETLELSAEH